MEEETKKLIEENLVLSKENNKLLLKIHGILRLNQIMRIAYWVIIILIAVGAFYFIQPFMDGILSVYGVDTDSVINILK